MAAAVILSKAAEADLVDIWLYISSESPRSADRLLEGIGAAIGQPADFPEIGSRRTDIADDARALVVGAYLVLYRLQGAQVEIIRVVHGARNLPDLL